MNPRTSYRIGILLGIDDLDLIDLVVDIENGVGVARAAFVLDADFAAIVPVDAGTDVVSQTPSRDCRARGLVDRSIFRGLDGAEIGDRDHVNDATRIDGID